MGIRIITILIVFLSFCACKQEGELVQIEDYEGPFRVLKNAVITHSDSGLLKGRLITPELHEFENLDRELPKGGVVEFYDETGTISATLKANYAFLNKEEELWKIEGDVVLENIANNESLKTELLYWDPTKGDIFTDKFVRIERSDEILTGTGLRAKQDFSTYTIEKIGGIFNLDE